MPRFPHIYGLSVIRAGDLFKPSPRPVAESCEAIGCGICDETFIKRLTYSDHSPTDRVKKYESFSFATGQKQANKNR